MRVLIIPEDPTLDQYILKPVIKAMLEEVGRPRANVEVCSDPILRSVEQAMRWERISGIIDQYPLVDLFLLIVDRDGDEHRRARLDNLQEQAATRLPTYRGFFAVHAWQEVEVWALAGCIDLPRAWQWQNIRSERDPKEAYFDSVRGTTWAPERTGPWEKNAWPRSRAAIQPSSSALPRRYRRA